MPSIIVFMDDTIVFGYADFGANNVDVTKLKNFNDQEYKYLHAFPAISNIPWFPHHM
jgi:hypothetical protein